MDGIRGELMEVEENSTRLEGTAGLGKGNERVVLVNWDSASDPTNPLNWSLTRKWLTTFCGIAFCFVVSMSVSAYSIATSDIQDVYHCSSEVAVLTVTVFTAAFAVVPLVLGPLSEIYGRSIIYLISATLHTLCYLPE
ncbi:hypothetical protein JCM8547_001495, partial [Rhodosporidiobolus lusitaniae]